MNNPKISVIVPVYNVEKLLHRCIDSILAQTFTDFELLLIDDGSKDKSGEICDEYTEIDARIRVFHKQNGGVSSARNIGLDNARGEWIGFVDSDDYVEENFLSSFFKLGQNADLLSQGFLSPNWQNKGPKTVTEKDEIVTENSIASFALRLTKTTQIGFLWCKLFRSKIINKYSIRFDENVCFMEDRLFIYNFLSHSNRVINVSETGYVYYFSSTGKTFGKQDVIKLEFDLLNCFLQMHGACLIDQEIKGLMSYEIIQLLCNPSIYKDTNPIYIASFFKNLYKYRDLSYNGCRKKVLILNYFPDKLLVNSMFRRIVFFFLNKM